MIINVNKTLYAYINTKWILNFIVLYATCGNVYSIVCQISFIRIEETAKTKGCKICSSCKISWTIGKIVILKF